LATEVYIQTDQFSNCQILLDDQKLIMKTKILNHQPFKQQEIKDTNGQGSQYNHVGSR